MIKELFYWFYFYISKIKVNKTPALSATFFVTIFEYINIFEILFDYAHLYQ